MMRTRAPSEGCAAATPGRFTRLAFVLATGCSVAMSGCFLADPRPDPAKSDGAAPGSDSSVGTGTDAGAAAQDAGPQGTLTVEADGVAASGAPAMPADVAVIGFMNVMLGGVGIEITNTTAGTATVATLADAAGGFAATVQAQSGDDLRIVVVEDGPGGILRGPPVTMAVGDAGDLLAPASPGDPDPADATLGYDPGLVTIVADGMGSVTVTGAPGATTAAAEVLAGNLATGASGSAVAGADGSFMLTIAGATGDMLVLFARVAGGGAASQTQVLVVP